MNSLENRFGSRMTTYLLTVSLIVISLGQMGSSKYFPEDFVVTKAQSQKLAQFKERVSPKLAGEKGYTRTDAYLIRFLRYRSFDLNRAEEMLFKVLEWRKQFDNYQPESWLVEDYPHKIVEDKEGMPVMLFTFGKWNIRRAAVAGKVKEVGKYMDSFFDKAEEMLYAAQAQGKNITRISAVSDLGGMAYETHLCPNCIPMYTERVINFETQFPYLVERLVLNNVPGIFDTILSLVRPLMGNELRKSFKVFRNDRSSWESWFRDWIDVEKLPYNFGGYEDSS